MRNYEIIEQIYKRCPKPESFAAGGELELTREQLFDRCLDIVNLIASQRPEIVKKQNTQQEAGIDY